MRTGTLLSGIGHGGILMLAVFGVPWFGPRERPPIQVTEVSFVSEAEFAAAQSAAEQAPRVPDAPPEQVAPQVEAEPEVLAEPVPPQRVEPPAPPEPEVSTVPSLAPSFNAEAPLAVAPDAVTLVPPSASSPVAPPRARPVERLAAAEPAVERPAPVAPPEPVAEAPAPVVEPAPAVPEPAPTPPRVETPSGAVAEASQPRARPSALARAVPPAATPPRETVLEDLAREVASQIEREAQVATPPTPPTVTAPTPPAPAQGEAATSLPVGPPITSAERDGLRVAVQRCWNVPAGLRDAQELRVTLAAELTAAGDVIASTIRLIEPSAVPDGRFQQAFEAGRRALIRCSPYTDLPRDKYAQWRNIEVVFNPEGIVSW